MYELRNNLPLLYDFYIIAKEGNITKAAEKINVSQPNLSRSINTLENTMNLKLLNRTNKGISLTKDGIELYKKIDPLFSNFNLATNGEEIIGTLTIGTTRNIADNLLSKYLILFNNLYPDVKIKILTDSASNLYDYLENHKIDVLIDYLPYGKDNAKFDMVVKPIGAFSTCFACSKSYYEKIKNNINTIKDLSDYNLVIPGSSRRRQLLDDIIQLSNTELNPIIEMPDSKLMIDFVKEKDFIGYFIKEELKGSELEILKLIDKLPTNPFGLIYHKSTTTDIGKKFIELVLSNKQD